MEEQDPGMICEDLQEHIGRSVVEYMKNIDLDDAQLIQDIIVIALATAFVKYSYVDISYFGHEKERTINYSVKIIKELFDLQGKHGLLD